MKCHKLRKLILAIIIILLIAALAIFLGLFRPSNVAPQAEQTLSPEQMKELVPRGRELAIAGDCFGCHSLPQGPMGAGGLAIPTPFGIIYSTNITPDKEYGIGNYTRADFHRAIRYGIAKDNRNLYPAMPFVFTHITTPDDMDALYAYNMSIPAMPVANKKNTGLFVLPGRRFMNFWALPNFPNREAPQNDQRSAEWNRGAYLVEGLGHCGSCHSPRNFMMGVDFSRSLEGGELEGAAVPDITAVELAKRGFDVPTLSAYLGTGISPRGSSFDSMYTVTHFSTSGMDPDDVKAIATYLLTDKDGNLTTPSAPPEPLPQAIAPQEGSPLAAGRLTYMAVCAGCHGTNGEGVPNSIPAMKGNSILAMDNPQTIIKVILNGIPTRTFKDGQRMYAMPAFAQSLNESQIADLVSWIRAEWGGQATPVTVEQVKAEKAAVK